MRLNRQEAHAAVRHAGMTVSPALAREIATVWFHFLDLVTFMLRGLLARTAAAAVSQSSEVDASKAVPPRIEPAAPAAAAAPEPAPAFGAASATPAALVPIIHPSYGPKYEPPSADGGPTAPRILVLLKMAATFVASPVIRLVLSPHRDLISSQA